MKNRANYLICLMEILFELKKIRYILITNQGNIYKPKFKIKKKDIIDFESNILDNLCNVINLIEKIIDVSYYKDVIEIKCSKYEYTENHLLLIPNGNTFYYYKRKHIEDHYKRKHIEEQRRIIQTSFNKIIELANIYENFDKDDITGEKFYKDYQYQYKINQGQNDMIEICYCLGDLEPDSMKAISNIGNDEIKLLKDGKPKIKKELFEKMKSFYSIN